MICAETCDNWKASGAETRGVVRYEIDRKPISIDVHIDPAHTASRPYSAMDPVNRYCDNGIKRCLGVGNVLRCAARCFPLQYMLLWSDDGACDCFAECKGQWRSHESARRFELRTNAASSFSSSLATVSTVVPMYSQIGSGHICASSTKVSIKPLGDESNQHACQRACVGQRYVSFIQGGKPECYCAHTCFGASPQKRSRNTPS